MERMLDPGAMQSARVRTLRRHDGLAQIEPPTTSATLKRVAHRQEVERLRLLAPRMIEAGQTGEVLAWIDALPPELQTGEPWVLHFLGIVLRLSNDDPARAFGIQEEAREAFFRAENWTGYARSLTELGLLAALLEQQRGQARPQPAPTDWHVAPEPERDAVIRCSGAMSRFAPGSPAQLRMDASPCMASDCFAPTMP